MQLEDAGVTVEGFFDDICFDQEVKSSKKRQHLRLMKAHDFFNKLRDYDIWTQPGEHPNLKVFLQLNPKFPDMLVLKTVKKAITQLQENEEFMKAIKD